MILSVVRHADALFRSPDGSDEKRPLSEKGLKQAEQLAAHFKESEVKIDLILCSPFRRTTSTAEIIIEQTGSRAPLFEQWLRPGMKPDTAVVELAAYNEFNHILLIGHQPDLSLLIEHLDHEERFASVPTASLHHLSGEIKKGGCSLLYRKEFDLSY